MTELSARDAPASVVPSPAWVTAADPEFINSSLGAEDMLASRVGASVLAWEIACSFPETLGNGFGDRATGSTEWESALLFSNDGAEFVSEVPSPPFAVGAELTDTGDAFDVDRVSLLVPSGFETAAFAFGRGFAFPGAFDCAGSRTDLSALFPSPSVTPRPGLCDRAAEFSLTLPISLEDEPGSGAAACDA